jgi:hemerythrin-like domain-containing protein
MKPPQDLAKWICEEHARVAELADNLRRQVAIFPEDRVAEWISGTRDHVAAFRSHLANHFALEKDTGYMDAVLKHCPALASEIDRLSLEHEHLDQILASVHDDLSRATPSDRLIVGDCRSRLQNLLDFMESHEHREDVMGVGALSGPSGT